MSQPCTWKFVTLQVRTPEASASAAHRTPETSDRRSEAAKSRHQPVYVTVQYGGDRGWPDAVVEQDVRWLRKSILAVRAMVERVHSLCRT